MGLGGKGAMAEFDFKDMYYFRSMSTGRHGGPKKTSLAYPPFFVLFFAILLQNIFIPFADHRNVVVNDPIDHSIPAGAQLVFVV